MRDPPRFATIKGGLTSRGASSKATTDDQRFAAVTNAEYFMINLRSGVLWQCGLYVQCSSATKT
jgi:hypothetical protein